MKLSDIFQNGEYTNSQIDGFLADKVDKVTGKGLSEEDFTTALKEKLDAVEGTHYKGYYDNPTALESAIPVGEIGDYADVDGVVVGEDTVVARYYWDGSDWVMQIGETTQLTATQIKTMYESNPDTNAFTDAEKTALSTALQSVVPGSNVTVDNTDPKNPIISASGGGGGGDVTAAGNNVFTGSNTFSDLGGAQYGGTLSTPLGPIPVFRNISFTSGNGSVDVNLADTQGILGYEFLKDVFAADFSQLEEDDKITVMLSKFQDWDNERVNYGDSVQAINVGGDILLSKNIYLEIDGIALAEFSLLVGDDGTSIAALNAEEVHGLESRVGTFPLAFDIERTYGSKETPLTSDLGWTKSSDDKRVYQEVYHNDIAPPTELASMTKVGDGVYVPSETNLIYIWCSLPNATTTADGYFYTVTQV